MTMLYGAGSGDLAHALGDPGSDAELDDQAGVYLTDGENLFRYVGMIANGGGHLVGLEDCRSLEIMWVPTCELQAHPLRDVTPR
jgi:hypothetical protein